MRGTQQPASREVGHEVRLVEQPRVVAVDAGHVDAHHSIRKDHVLDLDAVERMKPWPRATREARARASCTPTRSVARQPGREPGQLPGNPGATGRRAANAAAQRRAESGKAWERTVVECALHHVQCHARRL